MLNGRRDLKLGLSSILLSVSVHGTFVTNQLNVPRHLNFCLRALCEIYPPLLLGRVAVCTAIAAYSRQTFQLTICRSVYVWVDLSVQCIVQNGGSDPDAVWHGGSDGSRDEAAR